MTIYHYIGFAVWTFVFFWLWYFLCRFANVMNSGRDSWHAPFLWYYRHTLFVIPFGVGKKARLKFTRGDQKWADMFPGFWSVLINDYIIWLLIYSFGCACVVFPFLLIGVYLLIVIWIAIGFCCRIYEWLKDRYETRN